MNKDEIKTAVLGAIWTFEKSGYTNEELADEVNRLLQGTAEKCTCEKCDGYQKYLAWKAKQPKQPDPERMGELLGDYERDKRQLAEALETDPIHSMMLREVGDLKREAESWRMGSPQVVTTYTKSYVSSEFGDTSAPLEFITVKAGDRELANLPLREIVHIADELREEIERYRMEHKLDTRHRFAPNKKYPWFCAHCGYPPEHPVMHLPATADALASESQREAAAKADEKPDGQAENADAMASADTQTPNTQENDN